MKPYPTTEVPASEAAAFAREVGGPEISLTSWEGYVAGTQGDDLFDMHLSGVDGKKPVAGLTLAFVEDGAKGAGDLEARLRNAAFLEVRFNNGSGVVARHVFDGAGATTAAHADDPSSKALLGRAYNDAEALLQASPTAFGGSDDAKTCLASFLTTISDAARCVDDGANATECARVRDDAWSVATSCQGTETSNVLAGAGSLSTRSVRTRALDLGSLFSSFKGLESGGIGSLLGKLGGGNGGGLGDILGKLGGGASGGKGALLNKLLSFLPSLFSKKNFAGLVASPKHGAVTLVTDAEP
ncbi:MAG: hypothetical protein U0270_02075 [Labilithrix sp.]